MSQEQIMYNIDHHFMLSKKILLPITDNTVLLLCMFLADLINIV